VFSNEREGHPDPHSSGSRLREVEEYAVSMTARIVACRVDLAERERATAATRIGRWTHRAVSEASWLEIACFLSKTKVYIPLRTSLFFFLNVFLRPERVYIPIRCKISSESFWCKFLTCDLCKIYVSF
jgi:hypothetical protein